MKKIRLNEGQAEAKAYAYKYKVFSPDDLKNDKAISELFGAYILSTMKGKFYFTNDEKRRYKDQFSKHLTKTYGLTQAQLKSKNPKFTPEQIEKFRGRLSKHLSSAYKRVTPQFVARVAGLGLGAGLLSAINPLLGALGFVGIGFLAGSSFGSILGREKGDLQSRIYFGKDAVQSANDAEKYMKNNMNITH